MNVSIDETQHLGDLLGALLERDLAPAEEAAARAHLAACADCRRQHDRLSGTVAMVGMMGSARAPEGLAGRILRRMRNDRRTNLFRTSVEQKVPYEATIVVVLAAAMAVLVIGYAVTQSDGLFAKKHSAAERNAPAAEGRP